MNEETAKLESDPGRAPRVSRGTARVYSAACQGQHGNLI
jgi:hypothetical protein